MREQCTQSSYGLSPLQEGMLFHRLYSESSGEYIQQFLIEIPERLDLDLLEQAWQRVVNRHDALRTSFEWEGFAEPVQKVHKDVRIQMERQDRRNCPASQRAEQTQAVLHADRRRNYDLRKPPLMRVIAMEFGDNDLSLIWSQHHMIVDGRSCVTIFKEVLSIYEALRRGEEPALEPAHSYRNYIEWLQRQDLSGAADFWRHRLKGFTAPTPLPVDHAVVDSRAGGIPHGEKEYRLSPALTAELEAFARREKLTMNILIQGAWAILLSRYSGEEDVVFGTTKSSRRSSVENGDAIVGLMLNTLPVRARVAPGVSVRAWLQQMRTDWLSLREYEHTPLVMIKQCSDLPPEAALFDSLVLFDHQHFEPVLRSMGGFWRNSKIRYEEQTNYGLTLSTYGGAEVLLQLEYDQRRFELATIERILGHLQTLLQGMAADPEQDVSKLPLLTAPERHQLLVEFNNTAADSPKDCCLHDLVAQQAERTPHAVALVCGEERISYRELNARANQLAHCLRKLGVGPEVLVGVYLERSVETTVGIVGTLKAGGAYVPLSPDWPSARLATVLADAKPRAILTQEKLQELIPPTDASVLCLDRDWDVISQECEANPSTDVRENHAAYIIYTSGSTGTPKGVIIEHRSIVNHILWMRDAIQFTASDVMLYRTPFSFDAFVAELFLPLVSGARQVVVREEGTRDPVYLIQLIASEHVTVAQFVPSMLRIFLETPGIEKCTSLRRVISGGEVLSSDIIERFYARLDGVLLNHYGPTEATIDATFWTCPPRFDRVSVPIGRPIANAQCHILDQHFQPVPVGIAGELYIGGAGLARGYLNQPEMTAEKFIRNPFSEEPGARLYKSGDLARYLPDGNIEYLGRIDDQVKLRGFRIELGEIESALAGFPAARQVAVLAREDTPGDKRLVAYLAAQPGSELKTQEVRAFLRTKLPEYMVPSAFVVLENFPLLSSGKIDRKALPDPSYDSVGSSVPYVGPRNSIEASLAQIWAEVLRIPKVGIHDNFFDLGGHSLLATQVITRIRDSFGLEVPLYRIFESPTVEQLATLLTATLEEKVNKATRSRPPIGRRPDPSRSPLSFAQEQVWFVQQLDRGSSVFNNTLAVELTGDLNPRALHDALNHLLARHEVLRTTYVSAEGTPVQIIHDPRSMELPFFDLRSLAPAERKSELTRLSQSEARKPFDLEREFPFRVCLVQTENQVHTVLLTMHHIVSDGWSQRVLFRDLSRSYEAFSRGEAPQLKELPIQYPDYAQWQHDWLDGDALEAQLSFWKLQLSGDLPILELRTDRVRPPVSTHRGAQETFQISTDLTAKLKKFSRGEGVTLFKTLLAAFHALLHRYSGQQDILVGIPVAQRSVRQTERLIGFFVNTLVMRGDLSGDPTFRELLARTRQMALAALANRDVPLEKLVEELRPERGSSRTPLFQVMLAFQNSPGVNLEFSDLQMRFHEVHNGTSQFDITLTIREEDGDLTGFLEYSTDLFEAATIRRMAEHYRTLLEEAVQDPDQRISALALLKETERHQLLIEWNDTCAEYPAEQCVHELIEAQVRRTPEAVAAVYEDRKITYGELNARANQLAHHLRKLGVGPDVLVGICVERSLDMLVGLLGIMKAGGAYVPLDPMYPEDRVAFMVEDSGLKVLLSQQRLQDRFAQSGIPVICLDSDWPTIAKESTENTRGASKPENRAYVIFTSGSTGKPKGVQITHRALVNFLVSMQGQPGMTPDDILLAVTTISFDIAGLELYLPLITGARVVCASREVTLDGKRLQELLASSGATVMQATPATWQLLLESGWPGSKKLKVLCGGEALTPELARQLIQRSASVWNMYGPTETTVWSTIHQVTSPEPPIAIGRPIANTDIYILDRNLEPVPLGITGELYIGGDGVALGYLNRAALTAEKFIPNPFVPGARIYRTGDLARYRPDGNIECLGRTDHQVKLRGFRIEPGEIESVLSQHPDVRQNVVILREDVPGDKRLAAYLVSGQDVQPEVGNLKTFLRERLPEYMMPSDYVWLNTLPLTPNGKVNRLALPAPAQNRQDRDREFIAPRNEVEQRLAEIWGNVLKVERVGIRDNFFDLGGHSLLAVRLFAQITKVFGKELPLNSLFQFPTIEQLAVLLDKPAPLPPAHSLVPIHPRGSRPPLYWVPGGRAISALAFRDVSLLLGSDQPVYGLESKLPERGQEPESVQERATHYLECIRSVQPEGPYYLAGFCLGGLVAFEMAQQLQAQGQEVAFLALVSSVIPRDYVAYGQRLRRKAQRMRYHASKFLSLGPKEAASYVVHYANSKNAAIWKNMKTGAKKAVSSVLEKYGMELAEPPDNSELVNFNKMKEYIPGAYPGRVILFIPGESDFKGISSSLDPRLGWRTLAMGGSEVHVVPGTHLSILESPHVVVLAEKLKARMNDVQLSHESRSLNKEAESACAPCLQ